jgi:hypothetical protein
MNNKMRLSLFREEKVVMPTKEVLCHRKQQNKRNPERGGNEEGNNTTEFKNYRLKNPFGTTSSGH